MNEPFFEVGDKLRRREYDKDDGCGGTVADCEKKFLSYTAFLAIVLSVSGFLIVMVAIGTWYYCSFYFGVQAFRENTAKSITTLEVRFNSTISAIDTTNRNIKVVNDNVNRLIKKLEK